MMIAYHYPFLILHLLNNLIIVSGAGGLDCLFTDRREVKIGNKSRRVLWVRAKKHIADINIPVTDPKLVEGMETLGGYENPAQCQCIAYVPCAAQSAALSNSTSDVYDAMLLPRVASTTRCRVRLWGSDSAPSTNLRWLEIRIATC